MSRTSFLLSTGLVLLSNCLALVGVALNRSGAPAQTITLTELELPILPRAEIDDSSVGLRLAWNRRISEGASEPNISEPALNEAQLRQLGFSCQPAADLASAHQPLPVPVFVAFQLTARADSGMSQLTFADASKSLEKLRSQYPDQQKYLIVRAVIRARLDSRRDPTGALKPDRWKGLIVDVLPSDIHVPVPLAREIRDLKPQTGSPPRYSVTLHYGRNLEPWVAAVSRGPGK